MVEWFVATVLCDKHWLSEYFNSVIRGVVDTSYVSHAWNRNGTLHPSDAVLRHV